MIWKGANLMSKKLYACFGGFADQYWTNIAQPNFRGTCDCLSLCLMDRETGELQLRSQVHGLESPSTLIVSKDHRYIYCSNESHDFKDRGFGGGISAVKLDLENEKMEVINQSFAAGSSTCYVALDREEKYLLVANHGAKFYVGRFDIEDGEITPRVLREEGCVCLFQIRPDGGIGKILDRVVLGGTGIDPMEHASAHPHAIIIDEDDFIIIPNKGGDNIYVGKLNRETEKIDILSIYQSDFGSSPRYAYFIKGTPYVLVQNEYDGHLCSYHLDKTTGTLTRISRVDVMDSEIKLEGLAGLLDAKLHPWGCDVQVHPNNRFVYANNTQRIIRQFELNPENGKLNAKKSYPVDVSFGTRGIQVSPDGKFLVVTGMVDEKVFVYRIDQDNGDLTLISEIALPTPTALRFIEE